MRILILTPIELEFLAVRKHLLDYSVRQIDGRIYSLAPFEGRYNAYEIILTQAGMKNNNFALVTEKAIQIWEPSIVFLIGVAGGIKDLSIGDVLVANKVYGYESGKETETGYVARPEVVNYSYDLLNIAQDVGKSDYWKSRSTSATHAKVYSGPIASGDKVIADRTSVIFQRINQYFNDSIGIDMEGIGFGLALQNHPHIKFLNIRGISDLLHNKSVVDAQGSQELAIQNATAFAFEMIYQLNYASLNTTSDPKKTKAPGTGMNYKKIQLDKSNIESGNDIHIGDKTINNNFGYLAPTLALITLAIILCFLYLQAQQNTITPPKTNGKTSLEKIDPQLSSSFPSVTHQSISYQITSCYRKDKRIYCWFTATAIDTDQTLFLNYGTKEQQTRFIANGQIYKASHSKIARKKNFKVNEVLPANVPIRCKVEFPEIYNSISTIPLLQINVGTRDAAAYVEFENIPVEEQ